MLQLRLENTITLITADSLWSVLNRIKKQNVIRLLTMLYEER
jgi:hypothetical protein